MTQTVEQNEIFERVKAEIKRRGISQAAAAKQMEMSASALTQLFNGNYAADPKNHVVNMVKWLESQATQQTYKLPVAPAWVPTETAVKIMRSLEYVQIAGDVALVYGGAGVGKTSACHEYRRHAPNVVISTMNPTTATAPMAIEEIGLTMGIKELTGAARIRREIVSRLMGTEGLLIIDEAQHLSVQALDAIRSIHDEAKIGLAFVGNESVYTRMNGGNRASHLAQIFSRVGRPVRVRRVSQGDIVAVAQAFGVRDKTALNYLVEVGQKAGALRVVVKVLRLASMMAGGEVPSAEQVDAAWKELGV